MNRTFPLHGVLRATAWAALLTVGCAPKISLGPRLRDGGGTNQVRMERARNDSSKSGLSLAKAGDYQGALAAFKQAVRLDPNDDKAYFNLGLMQEKIGDLNAARESYRVAYALDDKSKYLSSAARVQVSLLAAERRKNGQLAKVGGLDEPPEIINGDVPKRRPPVDLRLPRDNVPPPNPDDDRPRPQPTRKTNPPVVGEPTGEPLPDPKRPTGPIVRNDPPRIPRTDPMPRVNEPRDSMPRVDEPPKIDLPDLPRTDPAPKTDPAPRIDPKTNPDPGTNPDVVRTDPVKPRVEPTPQPRGLPRVLVVQDVQGIGAKPDDLSNAARKAAAFVELQMFDRGGLLLVDRAVLSEEETQLLRGIDGSKAVADLAKLGRDFSADILVLVTAKITPAADLPDRLNCAASARLIRCDQGREFDTVSADGSATGEGKATTALLAVRKAAEDLGKKLPEPLLADWKK